MCPTFSKKKIMNKFLPAMILMVCCIGFTFFALNNEANKEVKKEVENTRNKIQYWMTEKFWEMDMASKGYKRNQDAAGVYWTDK
jgi:hypothetical protein